MNKNQTIGIIILIVVIIIGGFVLFTRDTHAPEETGIETTTELETINEEITGTPTTEQTASTNNGTSKETTTQKTQKDPSPNQELYTVITYTEFGFSPTTVTIDAGDEVFFWNKSDGFLWVASEDHETHSAYPETHIDNCGTALAKGGFDSCGNIAAKNGWTFVFNQKGSWVYHDHNDPLRTGTIIVR